MKKEIDNVITYIEKGKEKTINIKIKISSQYIIERYAKFLDSMNKFDSLRNQLQVINENMGYTMRDDSLKFQEKREKLKEFETERKEKELEIVEFGNSTILKDRFGILRKYLEKNLDPDDYSEDEYNMLLSEEFWHEDVDPAVLNDFMNKNILKDLLDDKKKL